jgi:eukaryotic-like serine/threonine-protein kinase
LRHDGADTELRTSGSEPLSRGVRFGDYRTTRHVGSGHGYELWEAEHTAGARVTLQVWGSNAPTADLDFRRYLETERRARELCGGGIVAVREHIVEGERAVLVLDVEQCCTLSAELEARGKLELGHAATWLLPVVGTVRRAHSGGLAHGGLTPRHILKDGLLSRVFGFGANHLLARERNLLACELSELSPPKRLEDLGSPFLTDAWALGAILATCLTGTRTRATLPCPASELATLLSGLPREVTDQIARLTELRAEDPCPDLESLEAVLARHVTRDSPRRHPDLAGVQTVAEPAMRRARWRDPHQLLDERFELFDESRSGAMGRVTRALDRLTGKSVAVKLLLDVGGRDGAARFAREANLLAALKHPAIVEYVQHGRTPAGEPYLAMEWLEGCDLEQYLTGNLLATPTQAGAARSSVSPRANFISIEDALTLGLRMAAATALLHGRGIVHRDIKPANIFLVDGQVERAKLIDLGVADWRADGGLTEPGALLGTPAYMAPEQAEPQRGKPCPASDIWAIGTVLYECLASARAFSGESLMAIFAKIVLHTPPPIQERRPDVPTELAALIERMLSKDPSARPRDGAALLRALERIRDHVGTPGASMAAPSSSLTMVEQRFGAVLLADRPSRSVDHAKIVDHVSDHGGHLSVLRDGSLLVRPLRAITLKDDAVAITRIALGLRNVEPSLRMAVTIGGVGGESAEQGDGHFGKAIDRVALLLPETPKGRVAVDEATRGLLEPHFEMLREGTKSYVTSEHPEGTRTLLGRPLSWVGRQRELGSLTSLFFEVVEESHSRVIVLTAPPGVGKTRLRLEFLQSLRQSGARFELVLGQGDSLSAGSPFVMLGPALRGSMGIYDGEPAHERERKLRQRIGRHTPKDQVERLVGFIGEMIGVEVAVPDESLKAARKDPMLLNELMKSAWATWLEHECRIQPLVLVLEDLHWGDGPSVKYVDAALTHLRELPFLVVALARPELDELFPSLWDRHTPELLRLRGLPENACRNLARQALPPDIDAEVVDRIVERAEGNAFFLEELIRMVADGARDELPATVLGMVQSRLDAFGTQTKRVLRAASVFGEVFWKDGVAALLGSNRGGFTLEECLNQLTHAEVLTKANSARIPGEGEYRFRHALLRDGAYQTLTAPDCALGHRLAAEWLEGAGESDALVLAEHWVRGEQSERAARWFHRAALQALDANDLAMVVRNCERAAACEPAGALLGAVRALEATAAYWRSEYEAAAKYGALAAPLLEPGSSGWFQSVGYVIVAHARLGCYEQVDHWFQIALSQDALGEDRSEQLICLCRGAFQLIFHGSFAKADRVLERIATLMQDTGLLDALALAQANHVRGVRAAHVGDVATFLTHLEAAIAAFERAGDMRNVRLETTTLAWCYAEVGDFATAQRICRENLAECRRIQAQQAVTYAKVNLGYILSGCEGCRNEARDTLEDAIRECTLVNNLRLEGWARAHLSGVEFQSENLEAAEAHARRAVQLLGTSPGLEAWALGVLARVLLALEQHEEALATSRNAMTTLEHLGGLLQGESLPPLTLARAYFALGQRDAAKAAIRDARERLQRRTDRLNRAEWQRSFSQLPEYRETMRLWAEWCDTE